VRAYFAESRRAFPDQCNELVALHHAHDAVIVEFDVLGTHLGPLRALPPTGRAFRCRMSAHFVFDGGEARRQTLTAAPGSASARRSVSWLPANAPRRACAPWVKWVQPSKCTGTIARAPRIFAASAARSLVSVK
jgi:hypothetical protein